jgi:hypothetical protein
LCGVFDLHDTADRLRGLLLAALYTKPQNINMNNNLSEKNMNTSLFVSILTRGAVKKFLKFFAIDVLVHHEFVPPRQRHWTFIRVGYEAVAPFSSKEAARQAEGKDS